MSKIILNLEGLQNEDEFHDLAISCFGFPHYYGRNRDAFWDCITDFVKSTEVFVLNFDSLNISLKLALTDYLSMLQDNEVESNGDFSVIFGPTSKAFKRLSSRDQ